MMSQHASKRSQQRGIPPLAIELFERYGAICRHEGADVLFMDKKARKRIARDFGGSRALRFIEPLLNAYAVLENGHVLTLAHRTKRFKR